MADLSSVLAHIPGVAGYEAARQQNQEMANAQTRNIIGQVGILDHLRQVNEINQIKSIMQSASSPDDAVQKLAQSGIPKAVEAANQIVQLRAHQTALEQAKRVSDWRSTAGQYIQPGQPATEGSPMPDASIGGGPAQPAMPATGPTMDLSGLLRSGVSAGAIDPLAFAKEHLAEQQPKFAPSRSPGYFVGGKWMPTPENAAPAAVSPLAKLIQERDALPPGHPNRTVYDTAITHTTDPRSQVTVNTPEPPVQTYTDAKGNLFERKRGASAWTQAVGPDGKPITGKVPPNPAAEQLYKDYSSQPQVKEANDLEAKMKPVADYMIYFAKTGKSVNANDAALAKLYLAATTSVGSRAYAMDTKQLASLPDLKDRLGNMASSFFAGKDLTDETRKEMFNYIIQRYKALDNARNDQKTLTTRRAQARGVPTDQIFGEPQ